MDRRQRRAIDREEHRERREEVRKRVAELLAKQAEAVYAYGHRPGRRLGL